MAYFKVFPAIFLDELRKNTRNFRKLEPTFETATYRIEERGEDNISIDLK
jgi:hypothetical protein